MNSKWNGSAPAAAATSCCEVASVGARTNDGTDWVTDGGTSIALLLLQYHTSAGRWRLYHISLPLLVCGGCSTNFQNEGQYFGIRVSVSFLFWQRDGRKAWWGVQTYVEHNYGDAPEYCLLHKHVINCHDCTTVRILFGQTIQHSRFYRFSKQTNHKVLSSEGKTL